jgi:hypothetical protein
MKPTRMRNIYRLTLVVLVVLPVLVGWGNTDATQASSQPPLANTDTEHVTLRITGMS